MSIIDYSNLDNILLKLEKATQIPKEYLYLAEVFSEDSTCKLWANGSHCLSIETTSDLPFGLLYNLSKTKMEVLWGYIKNNLVSGFHSKQLKVSEGASILLLKKKKIAVLVFVSITVDWILSF